MRQPYRVALPLLTWLVIRLLPSPPGLESNAWHYFAVFAAVIVGVVLEPIPSAAVGLLGLVFVTVAGHIVDDPTEAIKWALGGFSHRTVWLVFGAFILSMGYERSGLGRRGGLLLVKWLGGRTLGLGYAVALADLLLAPGTPSNTARSGGTIYPIVRNIPPLFGSEPGLTARKIGSYIMWTSFTATAVTSPMFLTSLAPNLLAVTLVAQATGVEVTWMQWFLGFLPIGCVLFLLVPWLAYVLYPPEIRRSAEVPAWAANELRKMGAFGPKELVMAALVVLALALWIAGGESVHPTTVVLIVISLMLVLRIVEWKHVLENRAAWNVFVWFATLVTLAGGLNQVGFVDWVASGVAAQLTDASPTVVMIVLVAAFFFIHYMFASLTAHTTAILPVFLAVGSAVPGVPVLTFSMLLCYSIGLMGVITPYATGPAPVYYASGYVPRADFWRLGFIFGVLFLVVLLAIGVPYLTLLFP